MGREVRPVPVCSADDELDFSKRCGYWIPGNTCQNERKAGLASVQSSCRSVHFKPGMRVKAVWGGDGMWYDAVVHAASVDGSVYVNWLRPTPLSGEPLKCVCAEGGDDTTHRAVPRNLVSPLNIQPSLFFLELENPPVWDDSSSDESM